MKYRDNMKQWEVERLLQECNDLDRAYEEAARVDARNLEAFIKRYGMPSEEDYEQAFESWTLRKAALDYRGEP